MLTIVHVMRDGFEEEEKNHGERVKIKAPKKGVIDFEDKGE